MSLYDESDFIDTVDENGKPGPRVPETWLGTSHAEGLKKKGRTRSSSTQQTRQEPPPPAGPTEPAGNASRDDWAAFAKAKGATDEDLVDDQGEPLGRDELRAKYGTPSGS